MNDHDTTDKILDEVAVRIRNAPVPQYPGPELLDSLISAMPGPVRESPTSRNFPRATAVAVGCSLVTLLAVVVGLMTGNVGDGDLPLVRRVNNTVNGTLVRIPDPGEVRHLRVGSVQVTSIDVLPEFDRMTDQLDRLSSRLQELETEVALREVQSDAATLLAEYAPRRSTVW